MARAAALLLCCWCAQWIIGNSLNITEDLFWIMSGRAQEVKENKMKRLEREEREREANNNLGTAGGVHGSGTSSNGSTDDKANLNREERSATLDYQSHTVGAHKGASVDAVAYRAVVSSRLVLRSSYQVCGISPWMPHGALLCCFAPDFSVSLIDTDVSRTFPDLKVRISGSAP